MENGLVDVKEMAGILRVPISWIYQKTRLGAAGIPHLKVGKHLRFNPEEVKLFFKKQDETVNN